MVPSDCACLPNTALPGAAVREQRQDAFMDDFENRLGQQNAKQPLLTTRWMLK